MPPLVGGGGIPQGGTDSSRLSERFGNEPDLGETAILYETNRIKGWELNGLRLGYKKRRIPPWDGKHGIPAFSRRGEREAGTGVPMPPKKRGRENASKA